jgi:CRISPR-associated endonuclease/helicase Cas3
LEVVSRLPVPLAALCPGGGPFLIAAHDLGKISPGFLLQSAVWRAQWQRHLGLVSPETYKKNHAWVSQKVLADRIPNPPLWLLAVGGHHGRYASQKAKPVELFGTAQIGDGVFMELREELFAHLEKEFGPLLENGAIEKGARLHWFTGMMIFSDWIGSNPTWFPLTNPPTTKAQSQITARQALEEIGWGQHSVRPNASFPDLFHLTAPNPLQKALHDAADAPGLYIVEAPMGGGKTEAALFASQRRWTQGAERGLYFALPTQLTSNRIHDRVELFLHRAVEDWSSIALVHGNAWLTEQRIKPLAPSDTGTEEEDPARPANQWFSDSRRALLAPFGVGTIDQALMAVLPVKFSALRMFALGGKVVVIDEVHSYDAYTSALVDRAVQWLRELHCTVIVLSATLTAARRASLVQAAGAAADHGSQAYPLITKVPAGSAEALPIEIPEAALESKNVLLETCSDDSWMDRAARAAESRACVLVIRNTVALAQETHRLLKEKCRDTQMDFGCIHSRFTQADRLCNESRWMKKLGKDPSERPASGAILVGTQVLEQSVDIDADLLITDSAPTDLLLQRIGRLHRHARPRPIGFEEPCCIILLPKVDWEADAKRIEEQLKPHRYVYPPFHLYMTERIWAKRTAIRLPSEIRAVLEESASLPEDLPAGAAVLLQELQQSIRSMQSTAWMNDVFKQAAVDDIEDAQTRWRPQPSAHLILLASKPVHSAGKIVLTFINGTEHTFTPGVFDFPLARLLHLHAIRLSRYLIQDALPQAPDWLKHHFQGAALAVVDDMNQIELFPSSENPAYHFTYNPQVGLTHQRNEAAPRPLHDDDESWF